MRQKTRVISVRVNEALYQILKRITDEMNKMVDDPNHRYTIGDTVRAMVQYFNMMYIMGQWRKPLPELKKEFARFLDSLEKSIENNNK